MSSENLSPSRPGIRRRLAPARRGRRCRHGRPGHRLVPAGGRRTGHRLRAGSRGAGASWGNAGWLTPGLTAPLPEPAVLRYGLALLSVRSPVYVPLRADGAPARFLAAFARHSTPGRWRPRHGRLRAAERAGPRGIRRPGRRRRDRPTHRAEPFLASSAASGTPGARRRTRADPGRRSGRRVPPAHRLAGAVHGTGADRRVGPPCRSTVSATCTRRSSSVPRFAVQARGGQVVKASTSPTSEHRTAGSPSSPGPGSGCTTTPSSSPPAPGSGGSPAFGVRQPVQAGRGYSFSVPGSACRTAPCTSPPQRVRCTPLGERLRVAGMMEFRRPDEPLDPRRIDAIVDAVRPFLNGVDLDDRRDEWVGSRPCTPDGLPLIGPPRTAGLRRGRARHVGDRARPVTGQLVAEAVLNGEVAPGADAVRPAAVTPHAPSPWSSRAAHACPPARSRPR